MAAKRKAYTPKQREEIVRFMVAHNAKKGRGGPSAARRKYGVSLPTLTRWMQEGAADGAKAKRKRGRPAKKSAPTQPTAKRKRGRPAKKSASSLQQTVMARLETISHYEKEIARLSCQIIKEKNEIKAQLG